MFDKIQISDSDFSVLFYTIYKIITLTTFTKITSDKKIYITLKINVLSDQSSIGFRVGH